MKPSVLTPRVCQPSRSVPIVRSRIARRAAVTALVVAVASALPPVQARVKAADVVAYSLGRSLPRPFAKRVDRSETRLGGVTGDLYVPGGEAPPLVLVHGAAPRGKDDPRLVRLARALAAADRLVFVPDLELKNRAFEERDLERIVESIAALSDHPAASAGRVQVVGISYGGSFALVAAADDRVSAAIEQIAVFGAYFDLVGYIQAITTGTSIVADRRVEWERPARAEELLREVSVQAAPNRVRPALRGALEGRVAPEDLGPEARRIYGFLANEGPQRTYELVSGLPDDMRAVLSRFSPSTTAAGLTAPVIVLHARNDPAVPYAESLRLIDALPEARLVTLEHFGHVDLEGGIAEAAPDLWSAWRFASWILSAQETFL